MAVYVLHFDPPFRRARHYVGFTDQADIADRFLEHVNGRGSPLVKAAVAAGSRVEIAHVFVDGDRTFERRIKRSTDVSRWCRLCGRHERPPPRMRPA